MAEVTDITGIGPAKAETLEEEGYDSVEALANANQDELAEVKGVGDDRALEYIVGANDLLEDDEEELEEETGDEFDLTPAELSEEMEEVEEIEEEIEEDDAVDEESEPVYTVAITFDNRRQYDTFHAALMRHHERHFTGNQPTADAMEKCLNGLNSFDGVKYLLTEYELNTVHSAVTQARTRYQGDNLIDHMDELKEVEQQIDELRNEYLF